MYRGDGELVLRARGELRVHLHELLLIPLGVGQHKQQACLERRIRGGHGNLLCRIVHLQEVHARRFVQVHRCAIKVVCLVLLVCLQCRFEIPRVAGAVRQPQQRAIVASASVLLELDQRSCPRKVAAGNKVLERRLVATLGALQPVRSLDTTTRAVSRFGQEHSTHLRVTD